MAFKVMYCIHKYKCLIPKTIMLPVVLHVSETCSLMVQEEHILKAFDKRVLKRIYGPMEKEVARGWRTPHNQQLHNLYISPNIIKVTKSRSMT